MKKVKRKDCMYQLVYGKMRFCQRLWRTGIPVACGSESDDNKFCDKAVRKKNGQTT